MDGVVTYVNHARGFCVLLPLIGKPATAETVFAHFSVFPDKKLPPPGAVVRFKVVHNVRTGRPQAMNAQVREVSGRRLAKTSKPRNV